MGIDEVKKEILDNARSESKKLLNEAGKERASLLAAAESRVEVISERLNKEADQIISQHRAMVLAEAASVVKKQRLTMERDAIDEVFENAKVELGRLSPGKRKAHLEGILKNARKNFNFSKVYCSKKDIATMKKYKAAQAEITGGAILEDGSGVVRVDLSYEALLDKIKVKELAGIYKSLFG